MTREEERLIRRRVTEARYYLAEAEETEDPSAKLMRIMHALSWLRLARVAIDRTDAEKRRREAEAGR